jgi:type II secretory pathway component PulC
MSAGVEDQPMLRFSVLAMFVLGCGGSAPPPNEPARVEKPRAAVVSAPAPEAVTSLTRAQVKRTIAEGLGMFLQNVSFEDWPVMHEGKFYGFKIKSINMDWGVDLRPGDVVTRVNGIVPERPDEADAALRSLEKAAALKVEFEREGKPRTLELPITD